MDNPFKKISANAAETSYKWESNPDEQRIDCKVCPRCGAPRPAQTNLAHCSYCKFRFMRPDVFESGKT